MDPAIARLLRALQSDYEAVMADESPEAAARKWADKMRVELAGPAWTEHAEPGETPVLSDKAAKLLSALDGIGRDDFWRPASLRKFREAVLMLG